MVRMALAALLMSALAGVNSTVRVKSIDRGGDVDPFDAPRGTRAIVFVFTSTDCPISNRYAPEIRRLAARFAADGIIFRLIYPNPSDQPSAIREHLTAFAYGGVVQAFHDPEQTLAKFAGATVTPETAVYAGRRLLYRGRIDDRYVDLGHERPAATVHDLGDALTAIVAGQRVPHSSTQAVGCFISDFRR